MAGRKNGLGRGLDALFPEKTPVSRENVRKPVTKPTKKTEISVKADQKNESSNQKKTAMMVKISNVEPNRDQPRKQFDEDVCDKERKPQKDRRVRALDDACIVRTFGVR